jgi:hypothetical protein
VVTSGRYGQARTAGSDPQDHQEDTPTRTQLTDPSHGTIVPESPSEGVELSAVDAALPQQCETLIDMGTTKVPCADRGLTGCQS